MSIILFKFFLVYFFKEMYILASDIGLFFMTYLYITFLITAFLFGGGMHSRDNFLKLAVKIHMTVSQKLLYLKFPYAFNLQFELY